MVNAVLSATLLLLTLGAAATESSQVSFAGLPTLVSLGVLPTRGRIDAVSGQVIENLHISNPTGPCIVVPQNVRDVTIRNNEIGPCGSISRKVQDYGIFVLQAAAHVTVRHNVIHDVASGLTAYRSTHPIIFENNFVFNIRGPSYAGAMIQFNGVKDGEGQSKIRCNLFDGLIDTPIAGPNYSGDHINLYSSQGREGAPIEIAFNRIRGALAGASESGSGIQLGDSVAGGGGTGGENGGGWFWVHDNVIVRTNGVGIGVAGGSHILVENNRVENRGESQASMTGWPYAAVAFTPGSDVVFRSNRGTGNLWAFNHDGRAGDGLYQDHRKSFTRLSEDRNLYGEAANLTPDIFNRAFTECL